MADFGIGIAGGVLIEVAKGIMELVEVNISSLPLEFV